MKLSTLLSGAALLLTSATFTGCNKNNSSNSSGLAAGKGSISFTTSSSFGGNTSYGSGTLSTSTANYSASTAYDQITIVTGETSGTNLRTAQLTITVPKGATTANGNITGDFATPSGATVVPVLLIGASNTGSSQQSYTTRSGTLTITKLTSTEVEGNFSGEVEDGSTPANKLTITDGKFAGKF